VLSKNINKPISEIMASPSIEFGKSKVTEILKRLVNKKLVDIEGTGRGTKYRIKS
jgi:ATP-dependent DNA helicase RecG